MQKGEIYWVFAKDLDVAGHEQDRNRPYVLVSRYAINALGTNVVGVPLSSKLHKANSHRILIQVAHMIQNPLCSRQLRDSVALTDHIRVLDPRRLELPMMGHMTDTAVGGIELGLSFLFDLR
jgi:mRNA-degrading endonuclease toxin of MazEF toxin-antitoxin module